MESYSDGFYGSGLYGASDTETEAALSSWSLSVDGHQLIFLNLGSDGTFIYDLSTDQWLHWAQEGLVGLGFRDGYSYEEFNLLGSEADGKIYYLDPDEIDDYSGPFSSIITGGFPARGRTTVPCYALYAAVNRSDETDRTIKLFISDDHGKTWQAFDALTPDSPNFEIGWRSLGTIGSPGRMFQIYDLGSVRSFDSLTMESQ